MTGTGTQADPFIVDNWPDFVTAIGTADAYVEFPETPGVIDVNESAPTGIPKIVVACASVQGNNWVIKNLYCKGHNAFSTAVGHYVSINRLHFLNFYFDDQGVYNAQGILLFGNEDDERQGYFITECQFSGIATCSFYSEDVERRNGLFNQDNYWEKCFLQRCSFNVKLNGYAVFLGGSHYTNGDNRVEYCNIKISGNSPRWTKYGDYRNCYITGESVATGFDANYGSANFNVINADFSDASSFECVGRSGEGVINLINTDLLPSGATIGTGFIGVTTAQLKDAAYLASLGFPIGVD